MERTIHTDRLTLQLFNVDDDDHYAKILEVYEEVCPRTENEFPGFYPRTREELDRKNARYRVRGIKTKLEIPQHQIHLIYLGEKFIGIVHLAHRWGYPDIGYRLNSEYWGHGYASEATKAAVAFWHSTVGIPEIYAAVIAGNKPSERVAEKIGLHFTSYITVHREDGTVGKYSAYMMPGMKAFPDGYEIDEKSSLPP